MIAFSPHEHAYIIDIDEGLKRQQIETPLAVGDAMADAFKITILQSGEEVDISDCMVTGYFIRPDQATVRNTGTASGNTCTIPLQAECYAYEGAFALAVNLKHTNGITQTVAVFDGLMIATQTDNIIVDAGTVVPDLDDLLAQITAMEKATAAAEAIADKVPYIGETGCWFEWNKEAGGYVDTGVPAQGEKGEPGAAGASGADGISPVVTVEAITGGHRVTITDASGAQTFDVLNGSGSGTGDMLKSVYDSNGNGIVDNAEKLGGKSPEEFAPAEHTHDYAASNHTHDYAASEHTHNAGSITGLATVATSGSYNDLTDKPESGGEAYTPGEVMTNKKWINGKPIYRSIVDTGKKSTNKTYYDTPVNVETIVELRGMVFVGANYTGGAFPLPYAANGDSTAYQASLEYDNSSGQFLIWTKSRTWESGFIFAEYTKTTDAAE